MYILKVNELHSCFSVGSWDISTEILTALKKCDPQDCQVGLASTSRSRNSAASSPNIWHLSHKQPHDAETMIVDAEIQFVPSDWAFHGQWYLGTHSQTPHTHYITHVIGPLDAPSPMDFRESSAQAMHPLISMPRKIHVLPQLQAVSPTMSKSHAHSGDLSPVICISHFNTCQIYRSFAM